MAFTKRRCDEEPGYDAASVGPSTAAFLSQCLAAPGSLKLRIHADDEMFLRELADAAGDSDLATWRYLRTGDLIAREVGQFVDWWFGGFDNLTTLLDFACGYGRVTRFLACQMPADRIWVSDIYPGAVSFQEQQFGVKGFVSVGDPTKLAVDRHFECILVISLFSHLPADLFEAWLAKLAGLVGEDGILIFSVHDASLLPPDLNLNEAGFRFLEESESRTLPKQQYGTMYVDETFVRKVAASVKPGHQLSRIPRALGSFQDVYLLSGAGRSSFGPFRYSYGPIGVLESVEIRGNHLQIQGRAADLTEGSEISISVSLDGMAIGHCRPEIPRPDVVKWTGFPNTLISGFSLTVNLPRGYSESDLLLVNATSSRGRTSYTLHIGGLADAAARFSSPDSAQATARAPLVTSAVKRLRHWARFLRGDSEV